MNGTNLFYGITMNMNDIKKTQQNKHKFNVTEFIYDMMDAIHDIQFRCFKNKEDQKYFKKVLSIIQQNNSPLEYARSVKDFKDCDASNLEKFLAHFVADMDNRKYRPLLQYLPIVKMLKIRYFGKESDDSESFETSVFDDDLDSLESNDSDSSESEDDEKLIKSKYFTINSTIYKFEIMYLDKGVYAIGFNLEESHRASTIVETLKILERKFYSCIKSSLNVDMKKNGVICDSLHTYQHILYEPRLFVTEEHHL
jgi:hypothetical protein